MKTALVVSSLLVTFTIFVCAQSPTGTNQPVSQVEIGTYAVVERGPHSRVWQRTDYQRTALGKTVPRVHRYTELAAGLHRWDTNSSSWVDASEVVTPVSGGAAAVHGQHQVFFPYDLSQGVIEMVTPQGQHVKSQPIGLTYSDGTNSVLIATLKSAVVGQIVGSNQVVYSDALTNAQTAGSVGANLVYTFRKGSFEQDVVLTKQLPTPESYGLASRYTRLQVITDFSDGAQPALTPGTIQTKNGVSEDDTLSWDVMKMARGRAFMVGSNTPAAMINKRWL